MAVGCFAACGDKGESKDSSGEKSEMTPEEAKSEYEQLDKTAKLFYIPAASSPAADKVVSIVDKEEIKKPDIKLDAFEAAAEITVDKFTASGEDLLQSLGGALNVNGSVLASDSGVNFDLAAAVNGSNIDIDLAADKEGALLTAPFLFSQPVYLSGSIVEEALNGAGIESAVSSVPSVDLEGIVSALESWESEKLTDANIKHLEDLFKGVIPEDAVTVSEVKAAEFKGNYITSDIAAECVTLTVDKAVYEKMTQGINTNVVTDEVFKDVVVSFLNCFGDELLSSAFGMTAEEIYNEFAEELKEELPESSVDDDTGYSGELTFRDSQGNIRITSSAIEQAYVSINAMNNNVVVSLVFTDYGKKIFYDVTKDVAASSDKTLSIYVGDKLLASPTVNQAIDGSNGAFIENPDFTENPEEAAKLAEHINKGVSKSDVSAFYNNNNSGQVVINRYFVSGMPAKLDVVVKDDSDVLSLTYWDVYSDANAREYGAKLSLEGDELLSVRGGANEKTADMDVTLKLTETSVSVTQDSAVAIPKEACLFNLTARRDENGFSANGSAKVSDAGLNATFNMTEKDGNVTAKADADFTDFKISADYAGNAGSGDLNLTFAEANGDNGCEIKAQTKREDGKYSLNADMSVKVDGQPAGNVNINIEHSVAKNDGKVEQDVKLEITSEDLLEFEASLKLMSDESTDKKPAAPSKDGAYIIENEEDAEGLADIINPSLAEMFGSSAPVIGNPGVAA